MHKHDPYTFPVVIRVIGSLWLAAIVLMLLLVALACATIFESTHGTEQALAVYYTAPWFQFLLALLAVNILAALLMRLPFSARKIGFVATHAGIVLILGGALVTQRFAVNGQLNLAEGQTAESFTVPLDTLLVVDRSDGSEHELAIPWIRDDALAPATPRNTSTITLGDLSVEVDEYLPDTEVTQKVSEGVRPGRPAIEVSLSPDGGSEPVWIFADEVAQLGPLSATFRVVGSDAEFAELLTDTGSASETASDTVRIVYEGVTYRIDVSACRQQPVTLGVRGLAIRVLRVLPHAMVGSGNKLTNASPNPVNPAIEVEVSFDGRTETRFAFARFPDFQSMHAAPVTPGLKLFYDRSESPGARAPIEVLAGPGSELYVRFTREGSPTKTQKIELGFPLETPWDGARFSILRRFARAGRVRAVIPVAPVREQRIPAVHVRLTSANDSHELWVQRHSRSTITLAGKTYDVSYTDAMHPLGFAVTLDNFTVGRYPGTERPRSFESRVTIVDAATGRSQSRIISMNHPVSYGGYTLYQSSYRYDKGKAISTLSVARDPGMAIVFTGYIATIIGMMIVLVTRLRDHRQAATVGASAARAHAADSHKPVRVSLVDPARACLNGGWNGQHDRGRSGGVLAGDRETTRAHR